MAKSKINFDELIPKELNGTEKEYQYVFSKKEKQYYKVIKVIKDESVTMLSVNSPHKLYQITLAEFIDIKLKVCNLVENEILRKKEKEFEKSIEKVKSMTTSFNSLN